MMENLNPENVYRTLEFVPTSVKDTNLKVVPTLWYCLDFSTKQIVFIQKHTLNLIRCRSREVPPEFENIAESTLIILVKEDDLDISETDRLEAVIRCGAPNQTYAK